MKKIVLLLASAVALTASAETVDLASGGISLETLAAGTDYTNSGSEVAELTVTTADATTNVYGGVISGKIRLVKKGNGTLRLTSANSYTGGSYVDAGILEGRDTGAFGSSAITVKGRTTYAAGQFCCVRFCAAGTFANDIVVENGVAYAEGDAGWQSPQIEFSATTEKAKTVLSGSVTGPSGDQKLWITDQDAVTILRKTGCDFRLSGTVTTKYLFGSPCNTLSFDGPVRVTRMWFNRSNNTAPWKNTGAVHFKSTANEIGRIGYGYNYIVCDAANVLNGTVLSADYPTSEATWTYCALNGYAQSVKDLTTSKSKNDYVPAKTGKAVLGAVVTADAKPSDSSKRTTLTIAPQDDSIAWCPTRFAGSLDVVFKAANSAIVREFYNRTHDTFTGTLTVSTGVFRLTGEANMPKLKSVTVENGGTFDVQTTTNMAYFADITAITVKSGGKLLMPATNGTWPFVTAIKLALETGADCQLPEGQALEVSELWVDGERENGGAYATGEVPGLTRGSLQVSPYVAHKVNVTWTGAAGSGNTSATEPTNWAGNKVPELTQGASIVTVTGGTGLTFAGDAVLAGLKFALPDAGASFTVSGSGTLTLGEEGLSTASATGARTYEIDMPIDFVARQLWNFSGAETTIRLRQAVSSQSSTLQLDRFGDATLELYGTNTFTGLFYLTNGVTHVYSERNGLGAGSVQVEMGRMPGGNAQVVFHGGAEERPIAWCQLAATSQASPMMRFAEGDTTLAGKMTRTKSDIETSGAICLVVDENAVGRFTSATQWDVTPIVNAYGPGTLYSGSIKSSSQLYLRNALKLHLSGEKTFCYSVELYDDVEVFCENDWAFRSSQKMAGGVFLSPTTSRLHLQGHDQGINFTGAGQGVIDTPADAPATVYVDFSRTDPRPQNMHASRFAGKVEGPVSFVSVGTNHTFETVGEIGATGSLTVLSNELALAASATWTNCSAVTVADSGTLTLSRSEAFGAGIGWTLGGDGVVSIPSGCRQKAAMLTVDGEPMPVGRYSATSVPSGVADSVKRHFAGGGVLQVGKLGLTVVIR